MIINLPLSLPPNWWHETDDVYNFNGNIFPITYYDWPEDRLVRFDTSFGPGDIPVISLSKRNLTLTNEINSLITKHTSIYGNSGHIHIIYIKNNSNLVGIFMDRRKANVITQFYP